MTPKEMLEFFAQHIASLGVGLEMPTVKPDYFKTSEHLESIQNHWVMIGLLNWRHKMGSPVSSFNGAVQASRQAIDRLRSYHHHVPIWKCFRAAPARYLEYLLKQPPARELIDESLDFQQWRTCEPYLIGRVFDSGVLSALSNLQRPPQWEVFLETFAGDRRLALQCQISSAYMEIIENSAREDQGQAMRAADRAASLFSRRRRDPYFSASGEDGGGPDNDHVVDYRLAAILRKCVPTFSGPVKPELAIHMWQWG